MATVHLLQGRRWLGWYNTPGSYEIAKQYGQLANSRFWDGLFPGVNRDPAQLFGLDGKSGPRFLAAHSGSSINPSGHLAHLIARKARNEPIARSIVNKRRSTLEHTVTTVDLSYSPKQEELPRPQKSRLPLLALIPIAVSIAASVLCGLVADWWCCGSIAFGVLASGLACFVIGSGKLTFRHPAPAKGAPPGDGILLNEGNILVIRGEEGAVNALTRGRFCLTFTSQPRYENIGVCSVLLTIQFLIQLLLIPQGTLFGQLMFVVTLGVSWFYNAYLSALDKEDIQTDILLELMRLNKTSIQKIALGTRTAQAVFTLLALNCPRPRKILDELLPNDTPAWRRWKDVIIRRITHNEPLRFKEEDWKVPDLSDSAELLYDLFTDAEEAYRGCYTRTNE
ncbi:hypothetical protein C8Q79DRAFT_999247 [Trametes meyenii]|nr:hypothetical protein C8Q79DRAFT_999247 [Trametes meyenii]